MDHNTLMLLGHTVKCLLDHMAAKWVHTEAQCIPLYRVSNRNNLLGGSVLKAALNQEIAETVDHEGVSLMCNGLDNVVFLFSGPNFEFLLQEN